jgi:DNA-binding winged helix-turn-helix (wHTH) protein
MLMSAQMAPLQSPEDPTGSNKILFPPSRYACFATFHLDFKKEELFRDGVRVKLQGKVYQALFALLQKPGGIVSREELRAQLWPSDTHVNFDANVNTTLNKLRQVLGDSSDRPAFVDTITRKGYSFIAKVDYVDQPRTPLVQEPAAELAPDTADAAHRFVGESARPEAALFAAQRDGAERFVSVAGAAQETAGDKLSFIRAALLSKWFTAGVVSLVIASMLFGAALVLYAHH